MKKDKKFVKDLIIGLFVGFVSGFFGAGGGLILVPYFSKEFKNDEKKSRATTVFCVLFMVIVSSLFYLKESKIDLYLSLKCILGGCMGSYIGTKILKKINQDILEITFIIFLFYTGLKMIVGK